MVCRCGYILPEQMDGIIGCRCGATYDIQTFEEARDKNGRVVRIFPITPIYRVWYTGKKITAKRNWKTGRVKLRYFWFGNWAPYEAREVYNG